MLLELQEVVVVVVLLGWTSNRNGGLPFAHCG
jgi:hypothetical protein